METNILSVLEHGAEAVESRRNALAFVGKMGAGALLSMMPFGLADEAKAQSAGSDVDILNFALTLEYLESTFYNLYVPGTTPAPTAPAPTPAPIPAAILPLFTKIRADEALHVTFLRTAISGVQGATPVTLGRTNFDFTGRGMFNPSDYPTFLILSQGFEDTGVRAYKGQAANISNPAFLTAALNIHSVEARHAAAVRKVRGLTGWIPGDGDDLAAGAPQAIKPNYAGEANMNGVSPVEGQYNARQVTEAFDEPLDKATVLGLVAPFIR